MDWLWWNNTLTPHVPLLTKSLDFCVYVKYSTCRTSVDDIAKLRKSIIDVIRSAAKKMLTHRGAKLTYRRDVSSVTGYAMLR